MKQQQITLASVLGKTLLLRLRHDRYFLLREGAIIIISGILSSLLMRNVFHAPDYVGFGWVAYYISFLALRLEWHFYIKKRLQGKWW